MKSEERDLEEENRLLEKELAEIKLKLKATEERAYQAELKSFVLDTLIEVADETYGLGLKKNYGSQR